MVKEAVVMVISWVCCDGVELVEFVYGLSGGDWGVVPFVVLKFVW